MDDATKSQIKAIVIAWGSATTPTAAAETLRRAQGSLSPDLREGLVAEIAKVSVAMLWRTLTYVRSAATETSGPQLDGLLAIWSELQSATAMGLGIPHEVWKRRVIEAWTASMQGPGAVDVDAVQRDRAVERFLGQDRTTAAEASGRGQPPAGLSLIDLLVRERK